MKSHIVKHSVVLAGHKTSVNLEEPFWTEGYRQQTQNNAARSDQQHRYLREYGNLSSAL